MWQRRHPNFDNGKWIDCTKKDAEKFGPGGAYGGWEIREMPSMARNEALLCRLMNARSIAFDRLPRADVQAIHDAIDALKQSELVKIDGEEYAVHPVVAAELLRLHIENKALRKQIEIQKDEWLTWEAKRGALEKDAERYRYLRSDDIETPNGQREICVMLMRLPFMEDQRDETLVESELDAAIDAALNNQTG